jgi:ankyrin repeat protein
MRRVDGATPLLVAAFAGNVKMCDLLLSFGADIEETDMMGDTSLFRAFSEDHADLAMALLAKGADLNARNKVGETPFMMSARSSEGPVFKKVLATGKSELEAADSRGRTALHHAVEYETRENIVQLLGAGASINHPDKKGSTVLHKAVAMGDADLVILLLDAGADPSESRKQPSK